MTGSEAVGCRDDRPRGRRKPTAVRPAPVDGDPGEAELGEPAQRIGVAFGAIEGPPDVKRELGDAADGAGFPPLLCKDQGRR